MRRRILAVAATTSAVLLLLAWRRRKRRRCPQKCAHLPRMSELRIGCGAGYQGDRVRPAAELLGGVKLDYLFLECLAERTLTPTNYLCIIHSCYLCIIHSCYHTCMLPHLRTFILAYVSNQKMRKGRFSPYGFIGRKSDRESFCLFGEEPLQDLSSCLL